jgi:hypothetical protein
MVLAGETGLLWLFAAILAAFAEPSADTQHARPALAADRLMEVVGDAPPAVHSPAFDFFNTGPPAAVFSVGT